jgi:hypothetical protein
VFELSALPVDKAVQVWPLVAPRLRLAMKRTGASFAPIEADVMLGRATLWIAHDTQTIKAAAVTYLINTEWRRYCEIAACAGKDRAQWLHLIEVIEDYARANNCTATRIVGRHGWKRILPAYRLTKIILEKSLHG